MNLIGLGRDLHKLSKTKTKIVLGGFSFNSSYKIIAISDGDLVLHAIADAILGACQSGDIGMYFSDTCIRNKNLDSRKIIAKALALAKSKKCKLVNVDVTIICDKIMISPFRKQITNSLKKLLKTNLVNVKATRFEQDKKMIAAEAIVLLEKKRNN